MVEARNDRNGGLRKHVGFLIFPSTLTAFQKEFPTDAACAAYIEARRWPAVFRCPKCNATGEPWHLATRAALLRCPACRADVSLTAGTTMHRSHAPLTTWFTAAFLMATVTPPPNAMQLQKLLELTRYDTAYYMFHKLRSGMLTPKEPLPPLRGDHVEVDTQLLVETRLTKLYAIGAVETNVSRSGTSVTSTITRARIQIVTDRRRATCKEFIKKNVMVGTPIRAIDTEWFERLDRLGYKHEVAEPMMARIVLDNIDEQVSAIRDRKLNQRFLQALCNERAFEIVRKHHHEEAFQMLLGLPDLHPTMEDLLASSHKDWSKITVPAETKSTDGQ